MSSYLGPLRRFWWLVLLAVPVAVVASVLVLYQVDWGSSGPKLSERHKPTYEATVQVLVTSSTNPYLRAEESPVSNALLDAANYLPFIVQSDRVAEIRRKKFGKLNGQVTAKALFAAVTLNRGLRPSSIPIIEVSGFGPAPGGASRLARRTVDALIIWLASEQNKAKVRRGGRIQVEPLRSPTLTVHQQKSTGLAVLVFVVVLLAFLALAWMLDRVFPSVGEQAPSPTHQPPLAATAATSRATLDGPWARPRSPRTTLGLDGGPAGGQASEPPAAGAAESLEAPPVRKRRRV